MLVDLSSISYVPILSVRPAEMIGLRELPEAAKRLMLPHILLRPWLGGGTLKRATDKIIHSCSKSPFIIELDTDYPVEGNTDVAQEMISLRDKEHGFRKWLEFVRNLPLAIPCLQVTSDIAELTSEIAGAASLRRGIVVRIPKHSLAAIDVFCSIFANKGIADVLFVIDFEQSDYRYLVEISRAITAIERIRQFIPTASIAISSTSFPSSFKEVTQQEIFERSFFNGVLSEIHRTTGLLYSDRGSARLPREGGGGVPAPRIDLPSADTWYFFRKEVDGIGDPTAKVKERLEAYKEIAGAAIASAEWNPKLNIWGTQMIKLTQLGSEYGITSPVRSTSARINIHLFKQALRTSRVPLDQLTEDDWVDL